VTRPTVFLESPLAGNVIDNVAYAKRCLLDSLHRGEAPFASHLICTLVLDDRIPEERQLGMEAGESWRLTADYVVVYVDKGLSPGVIAGIEHAIALYTPIEFRSLEGADLAPFYERYAHAPALRMPGEVAA
jgi:hypothetical protein